MTRAASPALVWILTLGVAVVGSNSLALSPILSDVAADLDASAVVIARANAAYGGATAISALLFARVLDRIGPQRLLLCSLAAMAIAMLASAAAVNWVWLAIAQAGAGLAAGVILPVTYALATAVAPPGRGAETLGRVLTGWSVSLVAGVPLSAFVAASVSWRASYVMMAAMLLITIVALSRRPVRASAPPPKVSLQEALRLPGVVPLLAVCLLFMAAFYGTYAYIGDHVRGALGLDAALAGLIVLAYGAGFGVAAFGDRLVDRFGAARLFPPVLTGIALIYAGLAPGVGSFAAVLALATLWGFANHFGLNILVLLLSRAAAGSRAAVLAVNSAVTYFGALIGAALFGLVYEGLGFGAVAGGASACTAAAALIAAAQLRPRAKADTALGAPASVGPAVPRH